MKTHEKLTTTVRWFTWIQFVQFLNIQWWHFSVDCYTFSSYLIRHDRLRKMASQSSVIMHNRMNIILSKVINGRPVNLWSFLQRSECEIFEIFLFFIYEKTSLSKLVDCICSSRSCHINVNVFISVRSLMLMEKPKGVQNLKMFSKSIILLLTEITSWISVCFSAQRGSKTMNCFFPSRPTEE